MADNKLENSGAEKWLEVSIPCLDKGFVRLVDYQGDDSAIVQAARVSYGKGTKKVSEDRGLIRYLMRHDHWTPFEMCEIKFHCKMPIFVARQWIRHRTANVNEYSLRYSMAENDYYVPDLEHICEQSSGNKQGREAALPETEGRLIQEMIKQHSEASFQMYLKMVNAKQDPSDPKKWVPIDPDKKMLARELARIVLPTNFYTQWYWKIDLRNLMGFLRLRLDGHAQYEIRVFAEAMAKVAKDAFPLAYEAFEDYQSGSLTFSKPEAKLLATMRQQRSISRENATEIATTLFKNKREVQEFLDKLSALGWLAD